MCSIGAATEFQLRKGLLPGAVKKNHHDLQAALINACQTAAASLLPQDLNLPFYGVHKKGLDAATLGKGLIQRTLMIVAPCEHLLNDPIMDPE